MPEKWAERVEQGEYRQALAATEELPDGYRQQVQAWLHAILGQDREAVLAMCPVLEKCLAPKRSSELLLRAKGVAQQVSLSAEDKDFLFLNEAHHISKHRAFARVLLKEIKAAGYKYFAVEALDQPTLKKLNDGLPIDLSAPLYIHDPEFKRLLLQARSLGFTFIQYELSEQQREACNALDRLARINCREAGQAENILKVVQADERAKTFVYVGFDHGKKCSVFFPDGTEVQWLAKRLKVETGTRILSVDQNNFFFEADKKADISSPILITKSDEVDGCYDYSIRHSVPDA